MAHPPANLDLWAPLLCGSGSFSSLWWVAAADRPHEVRFRCLMNGSNHREEADLRPLWLCPESLAKLCWATGQDPREHSRRVLDLLEGQGLEDDAALSRRTLDLLGG